MGNHPIVCVYHVLRRNHVTFKAIIRLKEWGVNRRIKDMVGLNTKGMCSKSEMKEAATFIRKNHDRINQMLNVLADDKSRKVWKSVMLYRAKGRPITKSLWSDHDQYFVRDIVKIGKDEVFVDGGAFDGDTIQHLLNYAKMEKGSIQKVIAFEPDHVNLDNLKKNFGKDNRIKMIGKGLSNEEKVLAFSPNGSTGCFTQADEKDVSQGFIKIPCTSIDKTPECRNATFIKMDIEGSEMDALMGSAVTIQRNRPKLAICIYHSLEDMVRIVEYVHESYPEYKLYIRQHTARWEETVLYAVM